MSALEEKSPEKGQKKLPFNHAVYILQIEHRNTKMEINIRVNIFIINKTWTNTNYEVFSLLAAWL